MPTVIIQYLWGHYNAGLFKIRHIRRHSNYTGLARSIYPSYASLVFQFTNQDWPLSATRVWGIWSANLNNVIRSEKHIVSTFLIKWKISWLKPASMRLLPDTQNCGLRVRRESRERFPRHRLQSKPLVSDPGMHHGTCVTHVPLCMSGSLNRSGGENVPGVPGACANRNFAYLARGPWRARTVWPGSSQADYSLFNTLRPG